MSSAVVRKRVEGAYHTGFEVWWLAIENIRRFDAIFDNSNRAIEKSHQVTTARRLGGVNARRHD